MTSKNKTSRKKPSKITNIVRLISDQRQMLSHAGCDKGTIEGFDDLLLFLRSASPEELDRVFVSSERRQTSLPEPPKLSDETIEVLPASDLVQIVGDDTTPRKTLERIAILRFRVPRGSMRSFSNKTTLVEKLRTLVRNEQAHATIEAVARGHSGPEVRLEDQEANSEKMDLDPPVRS